MWNAIALSQKKKAWKKYMMRYPEMMHLNVSRLSFDLSPSLMMVSVMVMKQQARFIRNPIVILPTRVCLNFSSNA